MKFSQTREELLINTVSRFSLKNRGINKNGKCSYTSGCAIGVEVRKSVAEKLEKKGYGISNPGEYKLLPNRLKRMGIEFLEEIQNMHDFSGNWNERGISERGKSKANEIIDNFRLKLNHLK